MGEMTFNPMARPGDPDWRVMYCEVGDGASGESRIVAIRNNPQRLDNLVGKIIRIIPDLTSRPRRARSARTGVIAFRTTTPSSQTKGARPEIWAYGLRNPHRMSWAPDPANPRSAKLIANSVGYRTWETVNVIERGSNHGWPYREGNQVLSPDQRSHAPVPSWTRFRHRSATKSPTRSSRRNIRSFSTGTTPRAATRSAAGYVYNGKSIPALRGKYIFGDITTGRFWYADYKEMLAADSDEKPETLANFHEVKFLWDNPNDSPDAGKQTYDSTFPINE